MATGVKILGLDSGRAAGRDRPCGSLVGRFSVGRARDDGGAGVGRAVADGVGREDPVIISCGGGQTRVGVTCRIADSRTVRREMYVISRSEDLKSTFVVGIVRPVQI